jgi:exonuclease III
LCCIQETKLRDINRNYLRVKGWKAFFKGNNVNKQAGVAIPRTHKIDFQHKVIKKKKKTISGTAYSSKIKSSR